MNEKEVKFIICFFICLKKLILEGPKLLKIEFDYIN